MYLCMLLIKKVEVYLVISMCLNNNVYVQCVYEHVFYIFNEKCILCAYS